MHGQQNMQTQHNSLPQRVFFNVRNIFCLFLARQPPSGPGPPHSRGFCITH